jgi:GT2 family glycosyltransferase
MVPVASVVVATYNRSARLSLLLDGLAKQDGVGPFEVIVVDDGSPDDTQAVLTARGPTLPFDLVALRQPGNAGPASARNRGWRAARAPVVCFTDDDCVPTPKWLAALVAGVDDAELVQGQTLPNPDHAEMKGPFSRTIHIDWEMGYYETCNMAYRRDLLERLGGFDEGYRYPFGEDTDLAWRAKEGGARSAFAPDAVVHHEITPSDWGAAWRDVPRREALVRTLKKHPGLRGKLGKGLFLERTHLPTLSVAASAVALVGRPRSPMRWAASAGLVLWYAWTLRSISYKPKARWQWAIVVPLGYVLDLREIAVLARAWATYRIHEP